MPDPYAERRAGFMRGLMNQGEQINPEHAFPEKLGRFMGKWTADPVRETYGIMDRAGHGEQMSIEDALQLALEATGGGALAKETKRLDRFKRAEEAFSNGSVADLVDNAMK